MPNFRLSPSLIHDMKETAAALAERRMLHMVIDFPLTHEEVQLCITKPELRNALEALQKYGAYMLEGKGVYVNTELANKGIVNINSSLCFATLKDHYRYSNNTVNFMHTDHLSDNAKTEFVKWYNHALLEARIAKLTTVVVKEFFGYHTSPGILLPLTIGVVMARWPALKLLVTDPLWKARFNSPPVSLKRYGWTAADIAWRAKWGKAMSVADMALTSADMLPAEPPKQPVTAKIIKWDE